jgi:hypothetical protein
LRFNALAFPLEEVAILDLAESSEEYRVPAVQTQFKNKFGLNVNEILFVDS